MFPNNKIENYKNRKDIPIIIVLILFFAPVYLAFIYTIPWQINTDEIVVMDLARQLTNEPLSQLFGMSGHFDFPAFIFTVYGLVSKFIGGIDLFHFRITHSLFGLLSIGACYLFFRLFLPRTYAITASIIVGVNHSFWAISRMAMRENSALLFEVTALYFLFRGFKEKSLLISFIGGALTGLTFYVYSPAKITILLWFLFLFNIFIFSRKDVGLKMLTKLGTVVLAGFIIVAGPIVVKTQKYTLTTNYNYSKEQLIIFPEGRALQQRWVAASSVQEGIKKNIINGLTMFNAPIHDNGYIYPNYGHGFLDPLTGILLWLGLVLIFIKSFYHWRVEPEELFMAGSFIFSWFFFTFLLTKNPNYTRLLVFLPFIGYLSSYAIQNAALSISGLLKKVYSTNIKLNNAFFTALFVSIIIIWNLAILSDFIIKGLVLGNDVGDTARYVESRRYQPNYTYYLAANSYYPYYSWGASWAWQSWIKSFTTKNQSVSVIEPEYLQFLNANPPFTIFMSENAWQKFNSLISNSYPSHKVHILKKMPALMAIEVTK